MSARRRKAAVGAAIFALAVWTSGWSVHAVHALRAALWPGLAEICSVADPHAAQPRPSSQCPVCAQFLAAAAPHHPFPLVPQVFSAPTLRAEVAPGRIARAGAAYARPAPRAPPASA